MPRPTTLLCAVCLSLACLTTAMAQGGGGGGGGGKGGRGGGPGGPGGPGGRGLDATMMGGQLGGQAGGNQLNQANMAMAQAMQNQNQNQTNMPTIAQLAATLMTTYDTDGNAALDVTELQAALAGLRSMMLGNNQNNQNNQGNGMAAMNPGGNADNQPGRPPRRR